MSDTQNKEQQGSTVDEHATGPRISVQTVMEAACDVGRQIEEATMSILPPDVTQHLINAKKELIQAGIRVGELAQQHLDKKADRAREIHDHLRAAKAAQAEPAGKAP